MTHGSLFSGIGGFDLAAQWMGWENVFHCECNPFGQKVLKYYWPEAISYEDITKTDFTIHRGKIDILTGGFPCQPYSTAGLRKGKEDERHLWPEMLRAIREIKPRWVVGENVLGLVGWNDGMVFEEVQADLEAQGYEVQPYVLPAASVGAPHRRDRVWFVAYSGGFRHERRSDSDWSQQNQAEWANLQYMFAGPGEEWTSSNSTSDRREREGTGVEVKDRQTESGITWELEGRSEGLCIQESATNSNNKGIQGRSSPGNLSKSRSESKQQFRGYNKPDNWSMFPTQSPVCSGNDGISSKLDGITFSKWRTESIKAGGNAIVPQVVHQIFKAIQEYENQL